MIVLALLFSSRIAPAQILEPLSAVPVDQREALYKRLDGYVEAHLHRDWDKLYGFVSKVGRGEADNDIYGCGGAVREGDAFRGIAEVHAVFEKEHWFLTGWTFRDSSEQACKEFSDPHWQFPGVLKWDQPMVELAHSH